MVAIKFTIRRCDYQTPDKSSNFVCSLLGIHKVEHEQQFGSSGNTAVPNVPQLIRSRVDRGINQDT